MHKSGLVPAQTPHVYLHLHRVSFRMGGKRRREEVGGICPPSDMLRVLLYMQIKSSLYKSFSVTINGNLCLCKNCPRFHQIVSIVSNKRSKIKISWGSMPLDPPSLSHALRMDTYLPPPQ